MAEYTFADVIIDPDDPRLEVGAEYYFSHHPQIVLEYANSGSRKAIGVLKNIKRDERNPFEFDYSDVTCIIRKKEPKKRYIPFDLDREEDRAKLRGAWIRNVESGLEYQVICIGSALVFVHDGDFNAGSLLEQFVFLDGTPCGKLVEE